MALPAGTYHYRSLYEYTDHRGRVCRGRPSPDFEIESDGVGDVEVALEGGHPQPGYDRTRLKCVLFRSVVNPASPIVYYRHTERPSTYQGVSINDVTSDATLATGEVLYTVGGELENFRPPPALSLVPWRGRVVALDAEQGGIWPSKPMLDDEWPGFHEGLSISTRSHALKPIALSTMDDKLLVWWRDAIGLVYGEPPDALGQGGSLQTPTILHRGVGLRSVRSLLQTHLGTIFQSLQGFYLLDAGLQLHHIGAPVAPATSANPCLGAALLHHNHFDQDARLGRVARFVFPSGIVWDYHLDHGSWSTHTVGSAINMVGIATSLGRCALAVAGSTGRVWVQGSSATDTTDPDASSVAPAWSSGWLRPIGWHRDSRLHRLMLHGHFLAGSTVEVFYDYELAAGDAKTSFGADVDNQLVEIASSRQRCHTFRLRVSTFRKLKSIQAEVSGNNAELYRQNRTVA